MKRKTRTTVWIVALPLVAAIAGMLVLPPALAEEKPAVQLNVERAVPRDVDDAVQKAIIRDYSAAWQAIGAALANNNAGVLKDSFIGFALDKLTQRVNDQQQTGLRTRFVDRGHKVEAIFYSLDGSAIELRDQATLETEVLDGNTVIHSDRAEIQYYVVMTGAEDRWKVRVLESRKD
jgi:hypothetical protein